MTVTQIIIGIALWLVIAYPVARLLGKLIHWGQS